MCGARHDQFHCGVFGKVHLRVIQAPFPPRICAYIGFRFRKIFQAAAIEAAELEQFKDAAYDCVVLNSVVQYFPSESHLRQVLLTAVAKTAAQGQVFIGDVRSLPLLQAFFSQTSIVRDGAQQAGPLRAAVIALCEKEEELIVDPQYFVELAKTIPRVSRVELLLKEDHDRNEMVCFRYDVVWYVEAPSATEKSAELTWIDAAELPTSAALAAHLRPGPKAG